jgi:hypothetical protein
MAIGPVKPSAEDRLLGPKSPLGKMALHIFCDFPDVKDLSAEQRCALHEFFHVVLAAGFRLYQVVPPQKANPIIRKKFGLVLPSVDDDD